jgi:hypothetical protein
MAGPPVPPAAAVWSLRARVLALVGLGLLAPAARCPLAFPPLVESAPVDLATGVSRASWLDLRFAAELPRGAELLVFLVCDGALRPLSAHRLAPDRLLVNPRGTLPPGASCRLAWPAAENDGELRFATAPAAAPFAPVHDRRDRNAPLPFPDDYFLVPDAGTPMGWRTDLAPLPDRSPGVGGTLAAMAAHLADADGWSPLGPLSVELSAAPDPASLPRGAEASLDPAASVGLFDLTPGPGFGSRVPFELTVRSDSIEGAPPSHTLVLFPGIPLATGGRYGLVLTDQVRRADGEPLSPSPFFAQVLRRRPLDPELERARPSALEVVGAAAGFEPLPIPRDDVALALRVSVRSLAGLPDDVLALREDVRAAGAELGIDSVAPGEGAVAALVHGTFTVPRWRQGPYLVRDAAGRPLAVGTLAIPFVLAIPVASEAGPAPIVFYQHGNPGSAQAEVPSSARVLHAPQGFAVAGFTDVLNRTYSSVNAQGLAIFGVLLATGRVPEFWLETWGEQLAFLEVLRSLGDLDLVPLGQPDGVPDLDPEAIVYEGISYGSNHGQGFVAYAPELRAAGLVVGAQRFAEIVEYQDRTTPTGDPPFLTEQLPPFVAGVTPPDIFLGLHLFQMLIDPQDPHNHAALIYRHPVEIDGTTRRASVLVVEGLGDSYTKNNTTRSLAWTLGPIPQLAPVLEPVSYLPQGGALVQGNIDAETSAAFVQFAPSGLPGIAPSPLCETQPEGHFCAQRASRALRTSFYRAALGEGAPPIGPLAAP